jgi:DNA segregation ATPase FtsK/SpoIIIE-like protein
VKPLELSVPLVLFGVPGVMFQPAILALTESTLMTFLSQLKLKVKPARQLAQEHDHISTSFLQRRLRIGYPRAARLMEQLEEEMAREKEEDEVEEEGGGGRG